MSKANFYHLPVKKTKAYAPRRRVVDLAHHAAATPLPFKWTPVRDGRRRPLSSRRIALARLPERK